MGWNQLLDWKYHWSYWYKRNVDVNPNDLTIVSSVNVYPLYSYSQMSTSRLFG